MQRLTLITFIAAVTVINLLSIPLTAANVPGTAITYKDPASGLAVATPSIVILPNGNYLVYTDIHGKTNNSSQIHLSNDKGKTWEKIADIQGQFWSTLFLVKKELYVIGVNDIWGQLVIRKSTDFGRTWTNPTDSKSGLILEGMGYHCSSAAVIIHKNRIYKCVERTHPDYKVFENWKAQIVSAPADSNLLDASSWTVSNSIDYFTQKNGIPGRWYEGNVVIDPNNDLKCVLRMYFPDKYRQAAMLDISPCGNKLTFDKMIDFYGSHAKFTIRKDPKTQNYYSIVSLITWLPADSNWPINPEQMRNVLALTTSPDLVNWQVKTVLLSYNLGKDYSAGNPVGFQYADFRILDDDIIYVLRNAWLGSRSWHDAAWVTFHRIKNFRSISLEDSSMDLAMLEYLKNVINQPGSDCY